jgi:hypothetical protein
VVGDALQNQTGAAADLERFPPARVRQRDLELELVQERVVAVVAFALVAARKVVVVGA